jgi:hypothetical protein
MLADIAAKISLPQFTGKLKPILINCFAHVKTGLIAEGIQHRPKFGYEFQFFGPDEYSKAANFG